MDPSTPQHSTRSRRAVPVTAIVVAAVGVLTAVTWVAGGLRATSNAADKVRPGATVDQGLFSVQVISARAANMKVGFEDKLVPVLAVRMRVTNLGEISQAMEGSRTSGFTGGVQLGPAPYRHPDAVQNDQAMGVANAFEPRLPRNVDAIWKLSGPPPQQATIVLRQWEHILSFEQDERYWSVYEAPIAAEVTVPVQQGSP